MKSSPSTSATSTPRGFEWIDANDAEHSVLAFARRAEDEAHPMESPATSPRYPRHNHRLGVNFPGSYREIVNTDAKDIRRRRPGKHGPDRIRTSAASRPA